ncbi:hypothetical protein NA57DRAFT_52310 [Rhizodiscina lignyota]|uniref:Uncharacterized protein n=1 Tax=Rhizodiscina lignyota TaxID=1504668 RepID=A0A9P4IMY5_9PEZI|nr:hypothetical protein NA57DRAFT_52310 [Rhizodiscina lignyota]
MDFQLSLRAGQDETFFVFEFLTDTSTWPEWNTYIPRLEYLERAGSAKGGSSATHVNKSSKMKEGDKIRFFASLPGSSPSSKRSEAPSDIVVNEVSIPEEGKLYCAVWSCIPSLLHPPCRQYNEIVAVSEDECEYRSYEEFHGIRAWLVKFAVGATIQKGLDERAEGLKKISEERRAAGYR